MLRFQGKTRLPAIGSDERDLVHAIVVPFLRQLATFREASPNMNIWLFTNMPSAHQIEFYNAIGRSGKATLTVRFTFPDYRGSVWEPRDVAFRHKVLFGLGWRTARSSFRICPRAIWEVLFSRYDFYFLTGGYQDPTLLLCACLLWLRRRPWGIWGEAPWPEHWRATWVPYGSARSGFVRRIRRVVISLLMRMAPRVFGTGAVAVKAYRQYGAREDKLINLPYTCDVARYQSVPAAKVEEFRRRHHLDGRLVYLFSGRMIYGKGVDVLLEAFQQLARIRSDAALVLLGDGPERQGYEASVDEALRDRIHFLGHQGQEDLPAYFNAAHVFVFPSRYDGWGMVVNEACGAALPIITTKRVGASYDLVVDGENGFVIPVDDVKALFEKMLFFADNRDRIGEFGARSRQLIASLTPEKGVEVLLQGVQGDHEAQAEIDQTSVLEGF